MTYAEQLARNQVRDKWVENIYRGKKQMTQNDVAKLTGVIDSTK